MGMTNPDVDALVKALGVQERIFLFCVDSGTDWKEASVILETVAGIAGKGLLFSQNEPLFVSRRGTSPYQMLAAPPYGRCCGSYDAP
jgi:hypothetical protein